MTILVFSKFQPSVLATNFAQMQEIKLRKEYSVTYFLWGGGEDSPIFGNFFFGNFLVIFLAGFSVFFGAKFRNLASFLFRKRIKENKYENFGDF
jgi:hypothetical protein